MSVVQSEIQFFQSSNALSSGGAISASQITDNVLNNLFADTPAATAISGGNDYKKIFVKNANASLSLQNALFWRSIDTLSSDDELWLGVGSSLDDDGSQELFALSAPSQIVVKSSATDTRVVTLVGEDAATNRITETLTLSGTSNVTSTNTYAKLYNASVPTTNSNTVTIVQATGTITIGTINASKLSAIYYQNVNTKTNAFKLGTISNGSSQGLWLKRVTLSGANAYSNNSGQLEIFGNTA